MSPMGVSPSAKKMPQNLSVLGHFNDMKMSFVGIAAGQDQVVHELALIRNFLQPVCRFF